MRRVPACHDRIGLVDVQFPAYLPGRISYGLYVYHGVMILATLAIFASCPGWVKWLICPPLSLGATISVSAVSYRWFETPFLRLKARFQYIRSASPAIG
jgi:peptidoglycan/LPS O-acetylase OafA/YrhL